MMDGIVLGGSLNCRKEPSKSSTSLGRFSTGTLLTVTNSSDTDWYQTTYNDSIGYVMKSFVAVSGDTVKVNASNVNVRDNASTTGTNVLYTLSSPTPASVLSVTSNWVNIQPEGKDSGWIHAKYVNLSTSNSSSAGDSTDTPSTPDNTDDPTFTAGHFGRTTKAGVRLRTAPDSDEFVQVVKGSMFMIEGTQTGPVVSGSSSTLWVKIRFGKGDGTHDFRYVHSSCFGETFTITPSVNARIVTIAQTLVNNTGGNLGLSGDWCQRFIYYLLGACGIDGIKVPASGYCGKARATWITDFHFDWHERGDGYIPEYGDLIYYGNLNDSVSTHVGIVVTGGNSFTTVEGNMGSDSNQAKRKVKLCTGSVSDGKCNNKAYQGFLRLSY